MRGKGSQLGRRRSKVRQDHGEARRARRQYWHFLCIQQGLPRMAVLLWPKHSARPGSRKPVPHKCLWMSKQVALAIAWLHSQLCSVGDTESSPPSMHSWCLQTARAHFLPSFPAQSPQRTGPQGWVVATPSFLTLLNENNESLTIAVGCPR